MENKRGRPTLSESEQTVRLSAKVPESVKASIEKLGGGNISLGVRRMIKLGGCARWDDRSDVPESSGVYLIFSESDELLYIGQTTSLKRRFSAHERKKQFANCNSVVFWIDTPEELLLNVESELIDALAPSLNGTPNPYNTIDQMPKSRVIRARVDQSVFDDMETLANRNRVKISDEVREAIDNHIAANLVEICPVCGSTEIKERYVFDRGLCRDVRHTRCADCGTEVE